MTSGVKTALERALVLVLLLAAAGSAWPLELNELMTVLARKGSGEARFSEQRTVRGFDAPLESSGTLSYAAPDRFTRRTLQPRAESLVVEGNTVTMTRGGRSRSFALDATPEAVVAVEAVRGTLTGNPALLRRHFEVSVGGDLARWTLELKPRDARAAGPLRAVHITGQRDELRVVETELNDGERSVMTIDPVRGQ